MKRGEDPPIHFSGENVQGKYPRMTCLYTVCMQVYMSTYTSKNTHVNTHACMPVCAHTHTHTQRLIIISSIFVVVNNQMANQERTIPVELWHNHRQTF